MNKFIIIFAITIIIVGIVTIPSLTEQFADAKSRKKIHFTQTITSSQDPGQGHRNHELAVILSPSVGTLYDGSLTYTASEPVQIMVLHEITKNDAKGQSTWTVDGDTVYGLSLVDPKTKAGSFEFTGAALALHTPTTKEFTATVSVDGWIRGVPTDVVMQKNPLEKEKPPLELSRANVSVTIPMHNGTFNGDSVAYIITDSNDQEYADILSKKQDWKVELAPPLSETPNDVLEPVYIFTNGLSGDGINGYQNEVFTSTPNEIESYSALRSVINVKWKIGQNAEVLDSEEKIKEANEAGRINLEETDIVLNMSQIKWPEGEMLQRENNSISNDMSYSGGQILDIDYDNMTVTFVAHRGWGPDGRTIYYIVTDATPTGPAEMMGVVDSPVSANLLKSATAVDLFQFKNGIKSSGPLGFQPGIASAALGDENYSPLWRIYLVEWNNESDAVILETREDISSLESDELITVSLARPMNSANIVNCPFIDPFQ